MERNADVVDERVRGALLRFWNEVFVSFSMENPRAIRVLVEDDQMGWENDKEFNIKDLIGFYCCEADLIEKKALLECLRECVDMLNRSIGNEKSGN